MCEAFDPYHRWLGIPPQEQPPNWYRLLGLELFESDPNVIDAMATRHIEYLQDINDGPHVREAQRLLNELATVRRGLLDADRKAAYDRQLRAALESEHKPPVAAPPPKKSPPGLEAGGEPPAPPEAGMATVGAPRTSRSTAPQLPGKTRAPAAIRARRPSTGNDRQRRQTQQWRFAIFAGGGAVCLVLLLIGGVWWGAEKGEPENAASAVAERQSAQPEVPAETPVSSSAGNEKPAPVVHSPEMAEDRLKPPLEEPEPDVVASFETPGATTPAAEPETPPAADKQPAQSNRNSVPTDGLLLWLDAADTATVELAAQYRLDKWEDKSGHGYQARVDSDGAGPELVAEVLGSKPVVRFSGADWLKIPRTSDLLEDQTEYTLITVARGAVGTVLSNGTGDAETASWVLAPGVEGFQIDGQSFDAASDSQLVFHVRSLVVDGNSVRWIVDGRLRRKYGEPPCSPGRENTLRIGCAYRNRVGAEAIFQGELAELLVYSRALPDEERKELEQAIKAKWLQQGAAPFPFDVPDLAAVESKVTSPLDTHTTPESDQMTAGDDLATSDKGASDEHESAVHREGFVILEPIQMQASAGSELQLQDDGSILVASANPPKETYRLTLEAEIPGITAILLEALPHESLPGDGPGLGPGGVFALAEVSLTVRSIADGAAARSVAFWPGRADNDSRARLSNDGDPTTQWTVRRRGERVPVLYVAQEAFGDPGGSLLELTLINRERLGRFRVWATSAANPAQLALPRQNEASGESSRFPLYVNLGGEAWEDPEGNCWVESEMFEAGSYGHEGGQSVRTDETDHPLLGTARRGLTAFRVDVDPGTYEVRLYFSEHWTSNPRDRLFAVYIEQQPSLPPTPGLGFGQPYIHRIPKVHVADSPLDIDFLPAHEDATTILNGVSIHRVR